MTVKPTTEHEVAIMVAATERLCVDCHSQGIDPCTLAEHMFDVSRTVLASIGGKRLMAVVLRKIAVAYDEAADKEDAAARH